MSSQIELAKKYDRRSKKACAFVQLYDYGVMKKKNLCALSAAFASCFASFAFVYNKGLEAMPKPKWKGYERCAGIARKGQNDCGARGHACAGKAAKDNDPKEWIYVPKGLCKKIAGGKLLK